MTFTICDGCYGDHDAILISFEVVTEGMLRTTYEYSLTYVSDNDFWIGDVIAFGGWYDLEKDEVDNLRADYPLDEIASLYIDRFRHIKHFD